MAPFKFEEQLKEKLEKRTIQPSLEAWESLTNRLDQQEKRRNHKVFWWLGIAASIVGIILVTAFVFDGSDSKTLEPTIVDIKNNATLKTDAVVSEDIEAQKQDPIIDSKSEIKPSNKEQIVLQITKSSEIDTIKKGINLNEAVVSNDDVKAEEQKNNYLKNPISNSDFEQAKLNDVVAEINRLNSENHGVSEAEIDSLLNRAEREILTNRLYNENTKTVDANALLQDVEADLEQSFRSRVFEALKSGYVTVKTAVAERNN